AIRPKNSAVPHNTKPTSADQNPGALRARGAFSPCNPRKSPRPPNPDTQIHQMNRPALLTAKRGIRMVFDKRKSAPRPSTIEPTVCSMPGTANSEPEAPGATVCSAGGESTGGCCAGGNAGTAGSDGADPTIAGIGVVLGAAGGGAGIGATAKVAGSGSRTAS